MTAAGTVDGFVAKFQDYFDMVPIAENDTFVYSPGATLNVEQTPGETLDSGFLADDQERGGLGGLVPQILTYPAHGTLSPGFYGDFTYTPNAGFTGTDSFTYQAADASVLSNVATVTLVTTGPVQDIQPIPNLTMYPGQSTLTVVLIGAEGGAQIELHILGPNDDDGAGHTRREPVRRADHHAPDGLFRDIWRHGDRQRQQ